MKLLASAIMAIALFAFAGCGGSKTELPATQNAPTFASSTINDGVKALSQAANAYISDVKANGTTHAAALLPPFNDAFNKLRTAAAALSADDGKKLGDWFNTLALQMREVVAASQPPLPATQNAPTFSTSTVNDGVKALSQVANDYVVAVRARDTTQEAALLPQFNAARDKLGASAATLNADDGKKLQDWYNTLTQQIREVVAASQPPLPAIQNAPTFASGAVNDAVKNLSQAANVYIIAVKAGATTQAATLRPGINTALGQLNAAASAANLSADDRTKLQTWFGTLARQMNAVETAAKPAPAAASAPAK